MTISDHLAAIEARAAAPTVGPGSHRGGCICVECDARRSDVPRLVAALRVAMNGLEIIGRSCHEGNEIDIARIESEIQSILAEEADRG